MAQKFFIRSNAPKQFGSMLLEWSEKKGLKSEVDLFLTRAVFLYVLSTNLGDARTVVDMFQQKHGKGFAPLANYCDMLLQVLERSSTLAERGQETQGRSAYPLFQKLREAYAPSLQRDTSFAKNLDAIAEMYFGVKKPQGNMLQGMMSEMMKGFLGGGPSSTPLL